MKMKSLAEIIALENADLLAYIKQASELMGIDFNPKIMDEPGKQHLYQFVILQIFWSWERKTQKRGGS